MSKTAMKQNKQNKLVQVKMLSKLYTIIKITLVSRITLTRLQFEGLDCFIAVVLNGTAVEPYNIT